VPNVFAYGTLMFPEVAGPVADIHVIGEPFTLIGYRRYEAKTRRWGNYPTIVEDQNAAVDGLLFRDITDKQLEQLDYFEGVGIGLYERKSVSRDVGGKSVEFFIYVCGPDLKRRLREPLAKPWNPLVFQRQQLPQYLSRMVYPEVGCDDYKNKFE